MSDVNKLQKVQNFAARIVIHENMIILHRYLRTLNGYLLKITYIIVMQHLPLNVWLALLRTIYVISLFAEGMLVKETLEIHNC